LLLGIDLRRAGTANDNRKKKRKEGLGGAGEFGSWSDEQRVEGQPAKKIGIKGGGPYTLNIFFYAVVEKYILGES